MIEKSKHIVRQQTIRCGFPISFGNLRRSCYGLSRRNSLFTDEGSGAESRSTAIGNEWCIPVAEAHQLRDGEVRREFALTFPGDGVAPILPSSVDSESMNAIAVTGSAHQSQEKKPAGTLPFMGLPTARLAECGLRDSYTTNPNLPAIGGSVAATVPGYSGPIAQLDRADVSYDSSVAGSNPAGPANVSVYMPVYEDQVIQGLARLS